MFTTQQHIENLNYYSDQRVQAEPAGVPVAFYDHPDGGGQEEVPLPWKWAVCDLCSGKGTHVNPSIDAGGLTAEDFHDDPDFAEQYRDGLFDVPCRQCRGRTTIPVVDEDACPPDLLKAYYQQQMDEAADRAAHLAELRMGA